MPISRKLLSLLGEILRLPSLSTPASVTSSSEIQATIDDLYRMQATAPIEPQVTSLDCPHWRIYLARARRIWLRKPKTAPR